MVKNTAFLFIKPHAVTDKVKELIKETFEKKGIEIRKEGSIAAEEIDKKKLVDKHYYAIASKATLMTPEKLAVPKDKFKEKFGLEWDEALKEGKALNAKDACEKFGVDAEKLNTMWSDVKKAGDMIKFGGGFYCGKMEAPEDKGTFYVFNGFFMSMRSKFVCEGASIYYYVVEWEKSACTWQDFRGKVLGPTDPAEAPEDSLRGAILKKWKDLDLTSEPNVGDNGIHASASPFEALAERMNWLGYRVDRDPWGKLLLKTGMKPKQVKDWSTDPQVTYGVVPITGSLFDTLEDTDSDYCLCLCQMIAGFNTPKSETEKLEKEVERLKAELEKYQVLEKAVAAIVAYVPPKGSDKQEDKKAKTKGKAEPEPAPKEKAKGKGKAEPEPTPKGKGSSSDKKKGAGKGKSAAVSGGGSGKGKGKSKK